MIRRQLFRYFVSGTREMAGNLVVDRVNILCFINFRIKVDDSFRNSFRGHLYKGEVVVGGKEDTYLRRR